jgi:hydroxymethylbilane synthase
MTKSAVIRLGTRGSPLALAQAALVAEGLRRRGAGVDIVPIHTEGDRLLGTPLGAAGGKGLFVRAIEQALAGGAIDVAVHSLKDVPADVPAGLALAAFPPRDDPRDVLVTREGGGFDELPEGAVLGTSSLRRRALALAWRPDLVVEPIRGNVDTRLRKLAEGVCHALVLAAAGLGRLGLRPAYARPLAPDVFVPAVGQGILGLEIRSHDRAMRDLVKALDDPTTRACALAERAYLQRLGASCATPLAGHAVLERGSSGPRLVMMAVVASEDGRQILRGDAAGAPEDAERLGRGLAESLLARGAAEVTVLRPGGGPA